ncbi:MAG: DsbA family oxidoreductase [Cyclobacteriaceae bacterium]|nr:DsbA family oxidoreductase [Cyclobacteriaceae bacterium]
MKIEIWSDFVCPFCYIGKRRFEKALQSCGFMDEIEIEWKSFQLLPDQTTLPGVSVVEHLAQKKGWSPDYAREMHDYVTNMSLIEGLHYDFDKAVVANTLNAHRLLQAAKMRKSADILQERLFQAYFCEGANIDDPVVLRNLGKSAGLQEHEIEKALQTQQYDESVQSDLYEARQIGLTGVPFFVFNNTYAISGAQPVEVFLDTLRQQRQTIA